MSLQVIFPTEGFPAVVTLVLVGDSILMLGPHVAQQISIAGEAHVADLAGMVHRHLDISSVRGERAKHVRSLQRSKED